MTPYDAPLAVEVRGLRKSFGEHLVLDDIDLSVPAGTVFALLGPNGAGKTTTIRVLTTLTPADRGRVLVDGHDVGSDPEIVRSAIGVTGQLSAVDNLLTGDENLALMANLRHLGKTAGRKRTAELLEMLDLVGAARQQVSTYSGGMRRRLDLAMTLVGNPRIIFLDEPTAGLDPRSRRTVWEIVRDLVTDGATIFLTTQYLDEADRLADRIAVLDQGRIVAEGAPHELKRLVPGGHIVLRFADQAALDVATRALGQSERDDDALSLLVPHEGGTSSLRRVLDRLEAESVEIEDLSIHTPDLDDVFLALTGPTKKMEAER